MCKCQTSIQAFPKFAFYYLIFCQKSLFEKKSVQGLKFRVQFIIWKCEINKILIKVLSFKLCTHICKNLHAFFMLMANLILNKTLFLGYSFYTIDLIK